jgi:L-ascorbate 6-phosphate lactonase
MNLKQLIEQTKPMPEELAVFYLAQAGFYFKTSTGKTVCIDPYLSDCCECMFGFKRMVPNVLPIADFTTDILVSTHSHADHLDPDLLKSISGKTQIRFVGSTDCHEVYESSKISGERFTVLSEGQSATVKDIEFRAIYADHGELAPEAVGFLMNLDGINVYAVGDTAFVSEKILASLGKTKVDIMIVPINPAFGNPGAEGACKLAEIIKPGIVIASHFGMFIEHGGNPGEFLASAKDILPDSIIPIVMAPGEKMIYSRAKGIISSETLK